MDPVKVIKALYGLIAIVMIGLIGMEAIEAGIDTGVLTTIVAAIAGISGFTVGRKSAR